MNATATSLTLVRRFRAPPARLWAAWTRPEVMVLWFGPHRAPAEHAEADLRRGGRFRVVLREADGERHEATGLYQEIEAERRLVFTWNWISTPDRVSRVTVAFRAVPEGTEVTLTHDRFADAEAAANHERGWTEALERLGSLLGAA